MDEIYDKCHEARRERADNILKGFSEYYDDLEIIKGETDSDLHTWADVMAAAGNKPSADAPVSEKIAHHKRALKAVKAAINHWGDDPSEEAKREKEILTKHCRKIESDIKAWSEEDDVEKAESLLFSDITPEENPFEKALAEQDLEKSDIMRAFSGTDAITIPKTGKEIKKHIEDVAMPKHTASLAVAKEKAEELVKTCGNAPTGEVSPWWSDDIKMEIPFKVYPWDQCYFRANDSTQSSLSAYPDVETPKKVENAPATPEQAQCREAYNDAVRKYCEIKTDVKALEIMLEGMQDTKTYNLTPRQLAVLHLH